MNALDYQIVFEPLSVGNDGGLLVPLQVLADSMRAAKHSSCRGDVNVQ